MRWVPVLRSITSLRYVLHRARDTDRAAMTFSLRFRAAVVSIALFAAFLGIWHLATRSTAATWSSRR